MGGDSEKRTPEEELRTFLLRYSRAGNRMSPQEVSKLVLAKRENRIKTRKDLGTRAGTHGLQRNHHSNPIGCIYRFSASRVFSHLAKIRGRTARFTGMAPSG